MSRTICNCPTPPGGATYCEPHQLAICRVENGVKISECLDPPKDLLKLRDTAPLKNWMLEVITRVRRAPQQQISQSEEAIIIAGSYRDPATGAETRFLMPVAMAMALGALATP